MGTYNQPGACCGCSPCKPCDLPAEDLTLSWTANCLIGGTFSESGTATITYLGVIAGVPTWETACIVLGLPVQCADSAIFTISCDPTAGTTYTWSLYSFSTCSGTPTSTTFYNTSGGGSGTFAFTLPSYTCSPLNIVLTGTLIEATITP
jgi:hypothetical protein